MIPRQLKVMYDYEARMEFELNLTMGDSVNVLDATLDADWWVAESNDGVKSLGLVPSNYLVPLTDATITSDANNISTPDSNNTTNSDPNNTTPLFDAAFSGKELSLYKAIKVCICALKSTSYLVYKVEH